MIGDSSRNKEDFMQVYESYKNTVFGIAFNYTKNNSDANDILQDVFLKYFTSKKNFNDDEHVKAWLIRVTINACKKLHISSWRKKTVPLDENLPFEDKEPSELFNTVMNLPKIYRIVVHLYYYEGFSIQEISSILKVKEGTIKVRLMRARSMLKNKLKEA